MEGTMKSCIRERIDNTENSDELKVFYIIIEKI